MTRYDEVRPSIKTGDILLFSGRGPTSDIIKLGTRSPWSHVGLAVKVEGWDILLSLESTTLSKVADLDTGKGLKGVQTVGLASRIRGYDGVVAVRHLVRPLTPEQEFRLAEYRLKTRGVPYEENKLGMVKAALGLPQDHTPEDEASLFCSEWTAGALQWLGLFPAPPAGPDAEEYVPRDLSSDAREAFQFVNGLYLPERFLKGSL